MVIDKIALRYLFSKKSHNAINIVSGVSAAAVGVVTAAMVCVLSVMNGFGKVVRDMFSEFDPELRITAAEGKYFATDTEAFQTLRDLPFVAVYSESVEDEALVEFEGRQLLYGSKAWTRSISLWCTLTAFCWTGSSKYGMVGLNAACWGSVWQIK